jgi:hypothetical protein
MSLQNSENIIGIEVHMLNDMPANPTDQTLYDKGLLGCLHQCHLLTQ